MNGRVPPQNIEAEMAVLGAMLLGDRGAIERVTEALSKEDFYRDAHGRIYEAMLSLAEKDEPVDIVTLQAELTRRGVLEQVGGYLYLVQLADFVPTTANITYYAKIVAEKGVLRRLIETASEIAGLAYGENEEIDSLVDQAERAIFNVARKRNTEGFTPLRPLLTNAFEQIDTLYHEKGITTGVNTGFKDLNYITSGFQPGELIIIAARPSMGKCLTANTLVDDPDTGERLTIEEAVQRKMRRIVGVSECGRVRPTAISDWIDSGIKPAFRVTGRTGRFVEVTGHHPFLTLQGWQPLHDLVVGNQIAIPRCHPMTAELQCSPPREMHLRVLAESFQAGNHFPQLIRRLWQWGTSEVMACFAKIVFEFGEFCTQDEAAARAVQHAVLRGGIVTNLSQTETGWKLTPFTPEPCHWPDLFMDEIVAIEPLGEQQVYDLTVPDGSNFIAQDIVVHNTALTMNIGQNAALMDNKVVATFSLEMSKESLVQRLICSEARVDAHKLRTGFLQDEDWSRLADAVQRLWDAPLFIDDTTDMSTLEMRARCRRLRAEQGQLDMVIVDYLQLMRGSSRNSENRNQEITEIARGLKSMARELDVPVIALSQLSRSVERREDKRPMLSDLRECVTGDTRLFHADSGLLVPIREIVPGQRILAVNGSQKVVEATVAQVWEKGIKPVFRVTTETGRVLRCTDNHPLLTAKGYKPLAEIGTGELIATARCLPEFGVQNTHPVELCRFLGYMAGDGHYGKHRTSSFIASDRAVFDDCVEIVRQHFPEVTPVEMLARNTTKPCWEVDFVQHHGDGKYGKPFGNVVLNWFRHLGLLGQLCDTKRVAAFVWEAGDLGARAFLAGYLATDGCVKRRGKKWDVHFDTVSHALARDVQLLLLRLGIVACVQEPQRKQGKYRPIYRVSINPLNENLRRFAKLVQPPGKKGELLREFLTEALNEQTNPGIFRLPDFLSVKLAEKTAHLKQQGRRLPEGKRLYWKNQGKCLRRDIALKWSLTLKDEELACWANSDLLWERIRSIVPDGEEATYDISVPETGCFLAEGVVVHNSGAIEAEADVVGFIYRPSYYARKDAVSQEGDEKADEERGGGAYQGEEAEVIIAKQRNGPTGTVKLAFLPKYARFADLEQNLEESPF